MQSRVASVANDKTREKKLGDIWEQFKGAYQRGGLRLTDE